MKYLGVLVLFYINIKFNSGSNILFASDLPSPSHQIWNYELVSGLLARGHNVTVLEASTLKFAPQKNYHKIEVEGLVTAVEDDVDFTAFFKMNVVENLMGYYHYCIMGCNHTLHSNGFKILLNYPPDFKFDLIIFDSTCSSCLLPLIQRFNYPPTVSVTAFLLPQYLSKSFGNSMDASYIPHYLAKFDENATFLQRLRNHIWIMIDSLFREYYFEDIIDALAKEAFGEKMDSLDTFRDHVSLLLCNLIQGYHYSQPLTPNIIPVGGLHIKPATGLPADLQRIMDTNKEGVILFSLGTNVKSSNLDKNKQKAILEALGKLRQTVLWKFEADLKDVPKNVIIKKWLPQREILAHPNMKLFISHGGALSTIEASYYGVPVVGMPFFADQHLNLQLMEYKKLAVQVNYLTLTTKSFLEKINEVLHNPVYLQNSKKMSQIMKDQPQTPLQRAVFWVEYVIRHNGTHFLDPASRHMSYFVLSSFDIYLFLLVVLIVVFLLLLKIIYFIKNCLRKETKKIKHD